MFLGILNSFKNLTQKYDFKISRISFYWLKMASYHHINILLLAHCITIQQQTKTSNGKHYPPPPPLPPPRGRPHLRFHPSSLRHGEWLHTHNRQYIRKSVEYNDMHAKIGLRREPRAIHCQRTTSILLLSTIKTLCNSYVYELTNAV